MGIEDAITIAMLLPLGTQLHDVPARLNLIRHHDDLELRQFSVFTRLNARDEGSLVGFHQVRRSLTLLTR